jgi:hypothetical protein
VTHLRKMMLEELQRLNYAETTIETYIRAVKEFSQHFNCSPDRLGPRHIREYQAALFQKRKFSPNTVAQHLAALRFFTSRRSRRPGASQRRSTQRGAFTCQRSLARTRAVRRCSVHAFVEPRVRYSSNVSGYLHCFTLLRFR